jgi:hypothetical protein
VIGTVLITLLLLLLAAAIHVIAVLLCHGSRERDNDQETGDERKQGHHTGQAG